jgi:uncharacterized protein involved in exopolysaccharide biosynthesis
MTVHEASSDYEGQAITFFELAGVLLKRWRITTGVPLLTALAAAIVSLILPHRYTATTSFVPESSGGATQLPSSFGGLAGLAAEFGVAFGAGSGSPAFYADLLRSRTIQDQLLSSHFDRGGQSLCDSQTLLDILRIEGDGPQERLEKGRETLTGLTAISVDNQTSVVTVSATTPYPELSAGVANLYVTLLNRFNLDTRSSNAQLRRQFIEERLVQAEDELTTGEEVLKGFLEQNRRFATSPELQFQYERLQRQVTIKEGVLITLRRQYEEARIEEVNDTPVITVVDRAVPPDERSSPKRKLIVIVAFIAASVVGMFGALAREFTQRTRQRDEPDYRAFAAQWAATKSEVRALVRLRPRHGRAQSS